MLKVPNVAWSFYPWNKSDLNKMLDWFFSNIEINKKITKPYGVVAPHAWYIYSWPIAAYSYQIIKSCRDEIPKTFVIMAPSHYEYFNGISIWLYDEFQTPLWNISVDTKLWNEIIKNYPDSFSFYQSAYEQEHALEVQLPFLQYIAKSDFKILPMIFGNVNPIEIWNILFEIIKKEKVFFIVSSDLSHYMSYENAVITDEDTLHYFTNKEIEKIVNEAEACGIHPRLALTQLAIKSKWKSECIKYMNSWYTAWDKSRVVWYWSVVYY